MYLVVSNAPDIAFSKYLPNWLLRYPAERGSLEEEG